MLRQHFSRDALAVLSQHQIGHRPVQPPPFGDAQRCIDRVLHQRVLEAGGGTAAHGRVAMRDVGRLQRIEGLVESVAVQLRQGPHQLEVEDTADRRRRCAPPSARAD